VKEREGTKDTPRRSLRAQSRKTKVTADHKSQIRPSHSTKKYSPIPRMNNEIVGVPGTGNGIMPSQYVREIYT